MSCRYPSLPFLPGNSFNIQTKQTNFHRQPFFEKIENVLMPIDKIQPNIPGKIHERYPSLYARCEVAEMPSWLAFEKETLSFDAFFQTTVQENPDCLYQIRKCKVYFYLEDGTIKVVEPKIHNNGMPEGILIARHKIRLPAPKDEFFYDVIDFNIGKEIEFYGKVFKITNCDKFTRTFIQRLGIRVPDPILIPDDPYIVSRMKTVNAIFPKKPNKNIDTRGKFLAYDRKVLRYYGYWDDRQKNGTLHHLVIKYYLVNDTVEITEESKDHCGKIISSIFIKRVKLPKLYSGLPSPGLFDNSTILNVIGTNTNGRLVMDSLNCEKTKNPFYAPEDLAIGSALNVYGRKVVITDCDPYTKEFMKQKYGLDDLTPIQKPKEKHVTKDVPFHERKLPPWQGYGSFEDSAQSCKVLDIQPLNKDIRKFLKLDKEGFNSRTLRFKAYMRSRKPEHCGRKFIVNYYLADNTMQMYELGTGLRDGTCFQKRERRRLPGQETFTSEPPDYFEPQHMFVGANITINGYNFILVDADQYTFRYMELHCNEFPKADIKMIMDKIRTRLKPIYKDFVLEMLPNEEEQPMVLFDKLREKLCLIMGNDWSEHEMITVARYFSGACKTDRFTREFIRQVVHTEIKKLLWDDLVRMKECFRAWDKEKTGYMSAKEIITLIKACKLKLDKCVLDNMVIVLKKNDKCEIEGEDLFNFLDINICPIAPLLPINIKREMCWASELDPISRKMIDWCAFNESLNLKYIFNEPNVLKKENEKI